METMKSGERQGSMSQDEISEFISKTAGQFFDISVNPIAGMFCTLLQLQVRKGVISKDEAKAVIISSLDLINATPHPPEVHSNGHEMLLRMINAIDQSDDASSRL